MIETHDLFLRALAVPAAKKKKKTKDGEKFERYVADEPKWPDTVVAFDTESRITVDQSLTFGVWRRCKLVGQKYEVIEEGSSTLMTYPRKISKFSKHTWRRRSPMYGHSLPASRFTRAPSS